MDGAILVIAADEPCPQPQTREHLAAIDTVGLENIIIVQNKIDIISREEAIKHYESIKEFVKGSVAENAPIIPVSAQHNVNVDILIEAMQEYLPTPERDETKPPRMYIVRSFDVNQPGTALEDMVGGVLGGSIIHGNFKVGDKVEIRPGLPLREKNRLKMHELYTEITSLQTGGGMVKVVANCKFQIVSINIEDEVYQDDKEMLEDLIIAAVNQAITAAQQKANEEMEKVTGGLLGGLNLPGGFKIPGM